jgi:calcium/calmodulin-dependent protein kinase I
VRVVLILCSQTAKTFIRTLVKPDPCERPTAQGALDNVWLTTHAPSTEHDLLIGIRENFDPRARWRQAIGAVRIMSRLANGARSKTKLDSSDEECEDGASQWRQKRDTPKQQHLEVPSPDRPKPKTDLVAIAAAAAAAGGGGGAKTPTPRMSSSSSSSSASFISIPEVNKAEQRDASKQEDRTTPPVQPKSPVRKTHASPNHVNNGHTPAEGHADPHKEDELRMPGSFDINPHAGGAAGAGPNSPQNAISVLGDLWRRMQLRS